MTLSPPSSPPDQGPSFPLVRALRDYHPAWLRHDVLAGVSVCVVMIPSVIAYAELAGLPPVHGLYAALAAMLFYALFASSRQVIAGPDAAVSLLVASAIAPLAGGDPQRAAALAAVIAVLVGAVMLLAARLRVGVIADFLSKPVLVGYLAGAALVLLSTQFGKLFGIRLAEREFFPLLLELAQRLHETHGLTLMLGVAMVALLVLLHRVAPRLPGALVVFVVALAASALLGLERHGVSVIGEVARGLPAPRLPVVALEDLRRLLPAALGIAFLTFPEGILLARAFAAKNRYEVRANQELAALAAANLAAGAFQGFCVGASQSRTTVNDAAGGRSQVTSLVAAAALVALLLWLTPLLRLLPTVALAAILIHAGAHLIEPGQFRTLYRASRRGCALAVGVALGVLVLGVVPGILLGVIVTLALLLGRLARPADAVLQEVPGTQRYHDLGDADAAQTVPGLIAYRWYAPLFFANADHLVQRVRQLIAASPTPVRWFVFDVQAVWEIDLTAADSLRQLVEELRSRDISLKIARANRPLREALERMGFHELLDERHLFPSVHAAVEAFLRQAGPESDSKERDPHRLQ